MTDEPRHLQSRHNIVAVEKRVELQQEQARNHHRFWVVVVKLDHKLSLQRVFHVNTVDHREDGLTLDLEQRLIAVDDNRDRALPSLHSDQVGLGPAGAFKVAVERTNPICNEALP